MPEEAATLAAGVAGATTTSGEKNKLENALTASKVARAGGPASTSFKVIDETSVTVPSKLPAVNRVAMSRPTGPEVAEAARRLDIDLVFDADLLYIAEELLMSPVPEGWEMHEDDKGRKYYASKATLKTQWQHPMEEYYKGVVFMRKEGEQLLEEKASRSPPTPEETREMARYFDTKTELDLLEIAKAAVNAPLPPEWEEFEDDSGEVLFYNAITKKTSEHHPLDAYFLELVRQRRAVRAAEAAANGGKSFTEAAAEATNGYGVSDFWLLNEQFVPYPWMEFVHPKNGQLYFYNFKIRAAHYVQENVAAYCHPVHLIRDKLKVSAVVYVQKMFRGWKARKEAVSDEAHAAASTIQRMFRGKKGRDTYQQVLHDKLVKAATRIQRAWRSKMAADEEKARAMDAAARSIQNQCRIRLARMRRSSQERFGPRALPPHVDSIFPPVRHLKERVTELLASPAPFAAALAALDAFVVLPEAGTEMRLKGAATAEGADVVESIAAARRPIAAGGMTDPGGGGGGGGGGASGVDGAVKKKGGGAKGGGSSAGAAPPTPVAPLASDLDGGGGGGGSRRGGVGETSAANESASETASVASTAVAKKKKVGGKGGKPKKKK